MVRWTQMIQYVCLFHPMVSEEKTPDLPAESRKPPATDDVQTPATDDVQTEEPLKVIQCHAYHTPRIVCTCIVLHVEATYMFLIPHLPWSFSPLPLIFFLLCLLSLQRHLQPQMMLNLQPLMMCRHQPQMMLNHQPQMMCRQWSH